MHQRILIICHNQHQLEKGLFLQNFMESSIDIVCMNVIPNGINAKYLEKTQFISSFAQIIQNIDLYGKFIFFSMVPSSQMLELVISIKKNKKVIIAIQETHQLSTHLGHVNNIIFTPDIILSASDREKELFLLNNMHAENKIFSLGWMFQAKYQNYVKNIYLIDSSSRKKEIALIVFGAPDDITLFSLETYAKRAIIINHIQSKFDNQKICIKLHPQEKREKFIEFLESQKIQGVEICSANENLYELSQKAKVIITSNKTQAFFDLIVTSNSLVVYGIGKENFISNFLAKSCKQDVVLDVNFYYVETSAPELDLFRDKFCKSEDQAIDNFLDCMNGKAGYSIQHNDHNPLESILWKKFYKKKLNADEASLIKQRNISLESLLKEVNTKNLSIRVSYTLLIMQEISGDKYVDKKLIQQYLKDFINPYIIQTFALDAIQLQFYIFFKYAEIPIHENAELIFQSIRKKSKAINILFYIERLVRDFKHGTGRKIIYRMLIAVVKIIKNIKS